PVVKSFNTDIAGEKDNKKKSWQKTHLEKLAKVPMNIRILYDSICNYIESLGDDVVANQLKLYLAYKKVQNIICIEIFNKQILLYLKLNPDTVKLEEGFTRDMRNIGHYGTGDLRITIKDGKDFKKAKELINRVYNEVK
ncbi:MAG TPA: DUF5655 domain-containing protein, partial [Megamonas hypermegale]|nr:DUF5655 domain-containing protein [Megamonas hypermegale]